MERGVLLPVDDRVDSTDIATTAESLGYDAVWTPELWGTHAFVRLTEIALATDDINLGTAIVNVFSRSAAVLAMAADSLSRVSADRFILGLGVSTPKAIEDLHGIEYDRPVRRAHETLELVSAFTRGDGRVTYDGELVSVADFPALDADVPLYYAALGSANRRVVGRFADGWIPHNVPFSRLTESFEVVATAAEDAGRDPDDVTVAPYVPAAVSDDVEEAKDAIRGHVAYYVGSGEGYRRAVGTVFPEEADAVANHWRNGDRGDAVAAVTDEMVEELGVAGTPESAPEKLAALEARAGIDHSILVVPTQTVEALTERTIATLAP